MFTIILCLIACAPAGCGDSNKREEGRAQLAQRVAEQLQAAKAKAGAYDFDSANAILRDLPEEVDKSPFADVATYDKLTADVEAIRRTVSQQEAQYRKKIRAGWKVIEGRLASPADQERALAEKMRREEDEARRKEEEHESETRPGRKLYVQADDVPVRETPSMSAAVILTINNGHEVIEITRQRSWVEVGVARTGKIGWIPASSLGTVRHGGATVTPETPQFKRFKAAFEKLNSRIKSATGVTFFTHAEDMGDGILYVTATETWLSGATAERESNLRTIYEMWRAAEGTGLPIAVYVLDERGKIAMKLSGD